MFPYLCYQKRLRNISKLAGISFEQSTREFTMGRRTVDLDEDGSNFCQNIIPVNEFSPCVGLLITNSAIICTLTAPVADTEIFMGVTTVTSCCGTIFSATGQI